MRGPSARRSPPVQSGQVDSRCTRCRRLMIPAGGRRRGDPRRTPGAGPTALLVVLALAGCAGGAFDQSARSALTDRSAAVARRRGSGLLGAWSRRPAGWVERVPGDADGADRLGSLVSPLPEGAPPLRPDC